MDISKINTHNQVNSVEKASKVNSKDKNLHQSKLIQDNVSIAQENTKVADLMKIKKIIQENNGIRLDKVEQAKANLESYFKDGKLDANIIDKIARNLTELL